MNKLQNYFVTLVLCIVIFALLQALSLIAVITIQAFSIFILLYGILGLILFYKPKKENDNGNN